MQTRIYNGPHPEVEVPLETPLDTTNEDGTTTHLTSIIAKLGEPVEVPDELAVRLDEQGETWLHEDGVSQAAKDTAAAEAPATVAVLRERAKEAGITVPAGAVKADIEALLEQQMQDLAGQASTDGATADASQASGESQAQDANATADGGKE